MSSVSFCFDYVSPYGYLAIQADLSRRNQAAADAGVFGVPTFAVGDELFFGNDRLELVKQAVLGVAA
ncbi:hypothetical protein B1810_02860 [Panacagrimonas perspica]|uniref:DsbA family protein n=1 Tax=Panacagrimonas perspica TaxID=381431 RepID=UPI00105B812B|nr:DsbA family protein [Panacagrimonas perspica]THD04905.1 hypothetical protein B1810_02860 [Panacagrimonas perspica]